MQDLRKSFGQCNFNSQPHKEADGLTTKDSSSYFNFNSQPHKEADPKQENEAYTRGNFNSQPHKEADILDSERKWIGTVFQLTASQGG